jgi:FlaA1/EpsC-like NDP-sugar epimerase
VNRGHSLRTLVVGAGEAGRALARDLRAAPEYGLSPVGFLDDDPAKPGLDGIPVLGTLASVRIVAAAQGVEVVVVAIPLLDRHIFRQVAAGAASAGASIRYLPSFVDALVREVVGSDMHSLDLQRLLGRREVHVATDGIRECIEGKRVLVTGAGGSIGSELCRQAYGYGPDRLIMLDHDESNLNRLQLELWSEQRLDSPDAVVADIRDRNRLAQIFDEFRPDVVFHAAAHKHLPLLEHNASEAVKSNVVGTENVVRAAEAHGTHRFINISTDKAADPTSILGATKRVAELIVSAYADASRFASVRFGNVLGSRGSLLTVLTEQVRAGVPVTVTHRDATRFFMTIEEAAGLVLEASRLATKGAIFVLDMGDPVRIVDIVEAFAAQLHIPDIRIRYTGLRPGEKLSETLFSGQETYEQTEHPRILKATNGHVDEDFWLNLADLSLAAMKSDDRAVRQSLARLLPDYRPPRELTAPMAAAPAPYVAAY